MTLTLKQEFTVNVDVDYEPDPSHAGAVEVLAVWVGTPGKPRVDIWPVLSAEDRAAWEQACAEDVVELLYNEVASRHENDR
jgi:hypothetical protein